MWIALLTTIFVMQFGISNGLQLVSNLPSSENILICVPKMNKGLTGV